MNGVVWDALRNMQKSISQDVAQQNQVLFNMNVYNKHRQEAMVNLLFVKRFGMLKAAFFSVFSPQHLVDLLNNEHERIMRDYNERLNAMREEEAKKQKQGVSDPKIAVRPPLVIVGGA